jgi:predicted Zn-dependent protease
MSDRHDEEPFEVISPLVPDRSGGARAAGGRTGGRAGRRSMRWAWLLAAGVIAMSACMAPPGIAPGPSPRVPRAGSQVSPDDITPAELARASAVQWQLLAERGAVPDAAASQRVAATLRRLIAVLPSIDPGTPHWPVRVMVLAERQADAWCLADGACVVTQGLLDRVGASDDRLAAALAHEMAHQLRGHPAERLALLRQSGAPAEPADWLMLPYSRVHEVEADRLGVELLVRAGFDPSAPLGFWEGIREGAPVVPFSARHPVTPSQLRDLTVYADRLEPLKPRAPANR